MLCMYAIRHKHSGKMLPFTKKGNTTVEPVDPTEAPPRLFKSYRAAALALAAWSKGVHIACWDHRSDDDPYSSAGGVYVESISVVPKRGRVKEDMEIVGVTLCFTGD